MNPILCLFLISLLGASNNSDVSFLDFTSLKRSLSSVAVSDNNLKIRIGNKKVPQMFSFSDFIAYFCSICIGPMP